VSETRLPEFDKYAYYTASVQSPELDMLVVDELYRDVRQGAEARTLREDFCGTFANCCAWVRLGPERRAVGVDLDPEPLAYGCANNLPQLSLLQQARVRIMQENVLEPDLPPADVIAAFNFSYFFFKRRAELLAYLANCRRTLEPGGLLVLDCFGGPGEQEPHEEAMEGDGFHYFFEEEGFDPWSHEAVYHLNFQRDGEEKRRAVFTLDGRAWTLPELRDALLEVGFASVRIYWKVDGPDGDTEWIPVERIEHEPNIWVCFVVASV
jgi:SAM-dependent methyltransferase